MNKNTDPTVLLAWIERQGWIATFTEHGVAVSYPITCERGARLLTELKVLTARAPGAAQRPLHDCLCDQHVARLPAERGRRTRTGASS